MMESVDEPTEIWRPPLTALATMTSVTRLGDLLDFEQLFKAFGNNYFDQIFHILRQYLGNFYRHLVIFCGHTDLGFVGMC